MRSGPFVRIAVSAICQALPSSDYFGHDEVLVCQNASSLVPSTVPSPCSVTLLPVRSTACQPWLFPCSFPSIPLSFETQGARITER
jgi:hypothetical protein